MHLPVHPPRSPPVSPADGQSRRPPADCDCSPFACAPLVDDIRRTIARSSTLSRHTYFHTDASATDPYGHPRRSRFSQVIGVSKSNCTGRSNSPDWLYRPVRRTQKPRLAARPTREKVVMKTANSASEYGRGPTRIRLHDPGGPQRLRREFSPTHVAIPIARCEFPNPHRTPYPVAAVSGDRTHTLGRTPRCAPKPCRSPQPTADPVSPPADRDGEYAASNALERTLGRATPLAPTVLPRSPGRTLPCARVPLVKDISGAIART